MNKAVYLGSIIFILVLTMLAAFYTKVEAKTIELTGSEKGFMWQVIIMSCLI